MEDNVSWLPRSNNRFDIWKHLLNHILVTEALNMPQKCPHMVLIGKFSQPYSQYPVRAWAWGGAVYPCLQLTIQAAKEHHSSSGTQLCTNLSQIGLKYTSKVCWYLCFLWQPVLTTNIWSGYSVILLQPGCQRYVAITMERYKVVVM